MAENLLILGHKRFNSKLGALIIKQARFGRVDTFNLSAELFSGDPFTSADPLANAYHQIRIFLESHSPDYLRNLIALLPFQLEPPISDDARKPWNPLLTHDSERKKSYPQQILASWLLLTFPEVHWLFLLPSSNHRPDSFLQQHFLPPAFRAEELTKKPRDRAAVLFDAFGLRNEIKTLISDADADLPISLPETPQRRYLAAAIDEEPAYAFFNSYAAYRFGYRAVPVTRFELFQTLFGDVKPDIHLLFEDLYLFFPDRSYDTHLSDLEQRDKRNEGLASVNIRHRILVTIGHKKAGKWQKNRKYLKTLRLTQGLRWKVLHKPFAGIFDLWKRSGLWNKRENAPKLSEGYSWPPAAGRGTQAPRKTNSHEHSTPGRLIVFAQYLINRARLILRQPYGVQDAIHAAVLALEAKELIGCRTPTLALEALALQHEAEIVAESMFYGIEYNLNVKDRFEDIAREVRAISQWFNPRGRTRSQLNARLTIIENLANKFRELNQFEEEQACLAEARKLRFAFWMRQRPWHWLAWPVLKYLNIALYSLPRFIAIVVLLNGIFGGIYWLLKYHSGHSASFWESLSAASYFFFTLQPAQSWEGIAGVSPTFWNSVLAFQGMISFSMLSLLIANIYLIISRR